MADKIEGLLVQLSSSYQDRCRLYLNECLEELSQRFELFQRQALDDLLRGCLALSSHALDPHGPAVEHEVDTDCSRRLPAPPGPALVLQPKRERCVSIYSPEGSSAGTPVGCACGCWQEEEEARAPEPSPQPQVEASCPQTQVEASCPQPQVKASCPRPQVEAPSCIRRKTRLRRVRAKRLTSSRRPRLDAEMRAALACIIAARPTISIAHLNAELRVRLPRKAAVSDDMVRRAARGVFFTLQEQEEAGEVGEVRRFAMWLQQRLRQISGPRVVFVAQWRFSVFLRRPAPTVSLLLALSAERGLESHRVTRDASSGPFLAAFTQAVADHNGPCLLVLAPQLRQHAARLAEAARCPVKLLPAGGAAVSPLRRALQAWREQMQQRLEEESTRSLLQDMQNAPACSAGAAADLLFQVLQEHAEAALKVLKPDSTREWLQSAVV